MPLFTVYHQALILQLKTRTFHQTFQGFPNEVDWFGGGGNLGKMAKNCMKMTKSAFLDQHRGGVGGDIGKPIFA